MECPKCGMYNRIHGDDSLECARQQQTNAANLGEGPPCKWCGARPELGYLVHNTGCPKK